MDGKNLSFAIIKAVTYFQPKASTKGNFMGQGNKISEKEGILGNLDVWLYVSYEFKVRVLGQHGFSKCMVHGTLLSWSKLLG